MSLRHLFCLLLLPLGVSPVWSSLSAAEPHFTFRNAAKSTQLAPLVAGVQGHGAAWGDVNNDGKLDLYVGTFNSAGPANMLLLGGESEFKLDQNTGPRIATRTTGIVFADLDNDGDLDLYVSSMPAAAESKLAARLGHELLGCTLFRNEGEGKLTNISAGNGACPAAFGGRSAAVLDFDGDGLLDLLVGEDPLPGYNGSQTASSRLFRNEGDLQFKDVTGSSGLPADIPGLGVAAGDCNNDGWPDIFLASSGEAGNRLLLNNGKGKFREAPGSREVFAWPTARGDNMVCGVTFGDVNRDGLLDVLLGQHYKQPWLEPVANRLYLNQGVKNGVPTYLDATEKVGLAALPMKSPHVEIQDFDNDGWPDIYCSQVKFDKQGAPHPMIFHHEGLRNKLPRFQNNALSVNDFPTAEDRAIKRTGTFFDKMIADGKIIYTAAGPSGDYDNDGRLDLFLANWWVESPSLLLHNETSGGHWLDVQVAGAKGVNRQGIGSRVNIYPAGKLGEKPALWGAREIATGYGYASGQPAIAHFGLGPAESVDVEVILPHGNGTLTRKNVKANQRVTINHED